MIYGNVVNTGTALSGYLNCYRLYDNKIAYLSTNSGGYRPDIWYKVEYTGGSRDSANYNLYTRTLEKKKVQTKGERKEDIYSNNRNLYKDDEIRENIWYIYKGIN